MECFFRCFPGVEGADLQMKIKTAGGHPKCDGDEKEVLDGMKSFPSGRLEVVFVHLSQN